MGRPKEQSTQVALRSYQFIGCCENQSGIKIALEIKLHWNFSVATVNRMIPGAKGYVEYRKTIDLVLKIKALSIFIQI